MKITGAQVFEPRGTFVSRELYVDGCMLTDRDCGGEVLDAGGCYAIPGLTDIHFHGAVGCDFSDGDADGLAAIAEYELSRGVTQICPAGMTLLPEALEQMCAVAAAHRRAEKPGASLCGINLEGPFLSMAKKGAQNGDWLQKPNLELLHKLEEVSGGLVKLVSVAPEVEGAMDFIRAASNEVRVSIAHTTAGYDTAMAAFAAGASHVTHLFNAMPPFTHRAPGVVGAAFDTPDCRVELICDGVHIHPSVVRAVFRLFGADRVVLVSDTMRAAGMADGDYTLGGQPVVKKGKHATLADGTLAGSVTDLMDCMRTAVSFGIPLADAVRAAAVNPARAIGIYSRCGSLECGKWANVVLLNKDLTIRNVIFKGKVVR